MIRVESPDPKLRRNGKDRYGVYGDQRPQEGRFEWRVPSGWWLIHPDTAYALFGTSKAVSEACYQRMADMDFDESYIAAPANRKGFLKDWGAMAKEKAAKLVNDSDPETISDELLDRTKATLRGLHNYQQYKSEIESFIDIINLSKEDQKNVSLDIKDNWVGKGKLVR